MDYNIAETLNTLRSQVRQDFKQTILDEMDDEDVIMYALRFFQSNVESEDLE